MKGTSYDNLVIQGSYLTVYDTRRTAEQKGRRTIKDLCIIRWHRDATCSQLVDEQMRKLLHDTFMYIPHLVHYQNHMKHKCQLRGGTRSKTGARTLNLGR